MQLRNTLMALLCLPISVCAQRPLHIGDTVPDVVLGPVVNYPSTTLRLSDFRGKLVILDFWATWCGSCQHAFPKLDSLQSLMGDQVQFVLVNSTRYTRDNPDKINAFFTKWKGRTGKALPMPCVVDDSVFTKMFPHRLIPHYVWIAPSGHVIATSSSQPITAENISAAVTGEEPEMDMKRDQNTDRPIFTDGELPLERLVEYSVFFKGWYEGLPSGTRMRESNGLVCGRSITNSSLFQMYSLAARKAEPLLDPKQVVVELADSSDFMPPSREKEDRSAWGRRHAYSLEVLVPPARADSLYFRMLELLNRYSGYKGSFEYRRQACWVVVKKNTSVHLQSQGGNTENNMRDKSRPYLKNANIKALVDYLNNLPLVKELVVNGTGYDGAVDLSFEEAFVDLASARRNLARVGLELRREERMMKVFVVRKKREK